MMIDFAHKQYAHCESGVMSNLLAHKGVHVSEPMAMGLTSVVTFAYIPLVKLNGQPLIAYRMPPKWIINGLRKKLGLRVSTKQFSSVAAGEIALDEALARGNPVGLQASVYWLPYFPADMRFHFNAHNLIVYGREGDQYWVSDPIFDTPMQIQKEDLSRARFAKGALAAKGLLYEIQDAPTDIESRINHQIKKSIRQSVRIMVGSPVPIVGIKGIRYLAKKIARLDKTHKDARSKRLFLSHIIRMQEEIGTGGAGFRFIYASFLQEASIRLNEPLLADASLMLTLAGDKWREFALLTAKMCKNKSAMDLQILSDALLTCANEEEKVWRMLKNI